jgi:hypothetical protein
LSPSPHPLPRLGGEGKGEGRALNARRFAAFVKVEIENGF